MDVSADLVELGRTPVAVFCSGAKSILDIPRTLEYLETQGVPVLTFHPEGQFPCFYTAASGCRVPTVASIKEAAHTIARNEELGLENGLVFGVPIPNEFESDGAIIQKAVEQAVQESKELGIDRQGKLVTPWLLKRVSQLAKHSVKSNVGLVLNNARYAAECAVALSGKPPSQVAYWNTPSPQVRTPRPCLSCRLWYLGVQRWISRHSSVWILRTLPLQGLYAFPQVVWL